MKATTGSSSATTTGSSSSMTTNVGGNGGRRYGRTSSRSVLLQVENQPLQPLQQQQQQQGSRQRSNRRSTNEVTRLPCDDELAPGAADAVKNTAQQNNNYKVEEKSSCETTIIVEDFETIASVRDDDVRCSDVIVNVDEEVVRAADRVASTTSSEPMAELKSASGDEDETGASNMDVSDDIDVPLVIDDRRLSRTDDKGDDIESDIEDDMKDDMVIELAEQVDDNCNTDHNLVESAIPNSMCLDTVERESSPEKFELESGIETAIGDSDVRSGLSSTASAVVFAASANKTETGETEKLIVLEVFDDCGAGKDSRSTEDKSLPSLNDLPLTVDEPIPDAGNVDMAEPEVTVLELTPSPCVVIEAEAPEDVIDGQSSTGRAADGSVEGDEDDDDDDEDQRHCESNTGSPTNSATANLSIPLVSRIGVRPAEVIEVVCGNQRARLDVRLLVAGLIRASNNTTSRAPCVLVEASAAATLAAATEGEANAEKVDEVPENLSGSCDVSSLGSRILTLTPNQFQKYSGRGTARDWKRSTRHYGASLKSLISRKILVLDPDTYGCYCNRCIGESASSAGIEGFEDFTGERVSSPKSTSSTSGDQENLPPPTSCLDDNLQTLSSALTSGGRTAATGINRSTIESNHGEVIISSSASVGSVRKRPSIIGFGGGCVDDGSGLPSASKKRKGSGSSLHSQMTAAEDPELTSIGGSWIKTSSGSKEEKMANIIRELRNYKNNLSEKIDANRRHSTGNGTVATSLLVSGQSSPVATSHPSPSSDLISVPSSRYVVDEFSLAGNPVKSTEKSSRSEFGLQPFAGRDLNATSSSSAAVGGIQQLHLSAPVRPFKSSSARRSCDTSSGAPRSQGRRRSQLPYKTDEHGALDLSAASASIKTSQGRSRTVPAKAAKAVAVASSVEADGVLDLRVGKPEAVHDKARKGINSGVVRDGGSAMGVGAVSWPPLASLFSASNLQKMLFWTVNDVVEFASRVPGCNVYTETLRQFGIDGSSLALLSVDQMTNILGMNVDVAKALRNAVDHAVSSPPTPLMSMTPFLPSTSSAAFGLTGPFGGNAPV